MQEPTWPKCHRTTVGVHWEPLGTIGNHWKTNTQTSFGRCRGARNYCRGARNYCRGARNYCRGTPDDYANTQTSFGRVPAGTPRFPQSANVQKILRGELPFGLALQKKLGDMKTASLGNVMVKTTPRRAVTNVFRATVAVVERRVSGKCAARGCGKYLGSCARTVPRREMVKN